MMNKKLLASLLVVFVALDLALTFWQNYQFPLDGDLVAIVWPAPWYSQVLHDPFGWGPLTRHEVYGATNRFFAHATMGLYWKSVPLLLQRVLSPISSLYAASALLTTASHALLVFLLAAYIRQAVGGARLSFWVAAALLVPLFQTEGFNEQMGVTNRAVTYTFFYATAVVLLLVLLWPFFRAACRQQPLRVSPLQALLLLGLMVVVAFNGPIATASIAIVLLAIGLHWLWARGWARAGGGASWLSGQAMLLLGTLGALCLYSIYIGRFNSENSHDHTLGQLYGLLPTGVLNLLTYQAGLPVLLAMLLLNAALVRWLAPPSPVRQRVLALLGWVAFFGMMYVLLLPFGGYRSYRPYLLRNDSALPILIGLIFAYGLSAYFLVAHLPGRLRSGYVVLACAFGAFFMYADRRVTMPVTNGCERWSLDQLARAPGPTVQLSPYCTVLSWTPFTDASQSEWNAEMLRYWHITADKKLYYNK